MKVLRRKLHLPLPSGHNMVADSIAKKMSDAATAFKYEELGSLDTEVAGAVALPFGPCWCFVSDVVVLADFFSYAENPDLPFCRDVFHADIGAQRTYPFTGGVFAHALFDCRVERGNRCRPQGLLLFRVSLLFWGLWLSPSTRCRCSLARVWTSLRL
jgi:hypothetical protein